MPVKSKIHGVKVEKVVDPSAHFDFPLLNNLKYTNNIVEKYLGKKNFLIKYLGKGLSGYAYLTKDNTVYKFTQDDKEAAGSLILSMFGNKLKTQSRIYKIYEIVIGTDRLFVIDKEYAKPVSEYLEDELNISGFETYKSAGVIENLLDKEYDDYETFELAVLAIAVNEGGITEREITDLLSHNKKFMRSIFEFNKELRQNEEEIGIPLSDTHIGNIGVKNDRVICFDCITSSKYILKHGGMVKNKIKGIKSKLSELPKIKTPEIIEPIGILGWKKLSDYEWEISIGQYDINIQNRDSYFDLFVFDRNITDPEKAFIDGGSFDSFEDAENWLIQNYNSNKKQDGGKTQEKVEIKFGSYSSDKKIMTFTLSDFKEMLNDIFRNFKGKLKSAERLSDIFNYGTLFPDYISFNFKINDIDPVNDGEKLKNILEKYNERVNWSNGSMILYGNDMPKGKGEDWNVSVTMSPKLIDSQSNLILGDIRMEHRFQDESPSIDEIIPGKLQLKDGSKILTDEDKVEIWYDSAEEHEIDQVLRDLGWKPYKFKPYPVWKKLGEKYLGISANRVRDNIIQHVIDSNQKVREIEFTEEETIDDIIPGKLQLKNGGDVESEINTNELINTYRTLLMEASSSMNADELFNYEQRITEVKKAYKKITGENIDTIFESEEFKEGGKFRDLPGQVITDPEELKRNSLQLERMFAMDTFVDMLQQKINDYFEKEYPKIFGLSQHPKVSVKEGGKYIRIDIGSSGSFMLDKSNNHLYYIKGYGVIDKKKDFGNIKEIVDNDFAFDGYSILSKHLADNGQRTSYGYAGPIVKMENGGKSDDGKYGWKYSIEIKEGNIVKHIVSLTKSNIDNEKDFSNYLVNSFSKISKQPKENINVLWVFQLSDEEYKKVLKKTDAKNAWTKEPFLHDIGATVAPKMHNSGMVKFMGSTEWAKKNGYWVDDGYGGGGWSMEPLPKNIFPVLQGRKEYILIADNESLVDELKKLPSDSFLGQKMKVATSYLDSKGIKWEILKGETGKLEDGGDIDFENMPRVEIDDNMESLIKKASPYVTKKYGDTYIQSQLYASRDSETSIDDIVEAIRLAKLRVMKNGGHTKLQTKLTKEMSKEMLEYLDKNGEIKLINKYKGKVTNNDIAMIIGMRRGERGIAIESNDKIWELLGDDKKQDGGSLKDKRYAVTTDMYIYAPDDNSAIKQSQEFIGDLRDRLDNQASIIEIVEVPTGKNSLKTRKLENVPKYADGGKTEKLDWEKLPDIDLGIVANDWIKLWDKFTKKHKLKLTLPHADPKDSGEQSDNAYFMLRHIIKIKNAGWIPDWKNANEYKYYAYFWMKKPGSGFAFRDTYSDITYTNVAHRLLFKTRELCESTAREFLPIYRVYMAQE